VIIIEFQELVLQKHNLKSKFSMGVRHCWCVLQNLIGFVFWVKQRKWEVYREENLPEFTSWR